MCPVISKYRHCQRQPNKSWLIPAYISPRGTCLLRQARVAYALRSGLEYYTLPVTCRCHGLCHPTFSLTCQVRVAVPVTSRGTTFSSGICKNPYFCLINKGKVLQKGNFVVRKNYAVWLILTMIYLQFHPLLYASLTLFNFKAVKHWQS